MPASVNAETADVAIAPVLNYQLPVATEFEVRGFIDLGLKPEDFVEGVRHRKAAPDLTYTASTVVTKGSTAGAAAGKVQMIVAARPAFEDDGRWQPHQAASLFDQTMLPALDAMSRTAWAVEAIGIDTGAGIGALAGSGLTTHARALGTGQQADDATIVEAVRAEEPGGQDYTPPASYVPGFRSSDSVWVKATAAQYNLGAAGASAPVLAAASSAQYQLAVRRNMYGALGKVMVTVINEARPRLHIVEHYRIANYLGDYGAANTVGTFTLLPGEKTTITLSTAVKAETTRDLTSNMLDSYNEQSSQEFERQLSDQRSLGINTTDQSGDTTVTNSATQMGGGASVSGGVNLGIVSFGGSAHADIAHQSSETDTATSNSVRQQSVNDVQSALDHHVSQSSAARNRQVSTGSRDSSSVTSETSNVEVRQIENINRSRVLNFVVRQLVQEYHSVTYLHEVSFMFENGFIDDLATAKLDSLNDLITTVIVPERQAAVLGRIMHTLYNVRDAADELRQFVEPLPTGEMKAPPGLPVPATTEKLPQFRRRARKAFLEPPTAGIEPIGAAVTIGGHPVCVDGVVLDVRSRVLRTNSVVTDAVLGGGEALDAYNHALQGEAVRSETLANDREAAAIDALSGLDSADKANAWAEMFNPPAPSIATEAQP